MESGSASPADAAAISLRWNSARSGFGHATSAIHRRLWRRADPSLPEQERHALTAELMAARRAKGVALRAGDDAGREAARERVEAAKRALGERGPVWWSDGAPDLTRHLARTTAYADWFAALDPGQG